MDVCRRPTSDQVSPPSHEGSPQLANLLFWPRGAEHRGVLHPRQHRGHKGTALKVPALADRGRPGMTALLDDSTATTRDALDAVLNRVDPAHFWRCAIGVADVASAAAASFTPPHEPPKRCRASRFWPWAASAWARSADDVSMEHRQIRRGRLEQMGNHPRRGQESGTP